jgi:MarR family transcriptional regulator, 2-MHQ and catechol-resistance regulon repressor
LTAKGEELMETIFPVHADAIEEAMSGLSAEEKRTAIELLKQLGRTAATV